LMANRHAPRDSILPAVGAQGLSENEVTQILSQALGVANQSRAQIRRPVGSAAQVTVSVVDVGGNILGVARTPDAPVFGTDVSLQKARTAAFFSRAGAATALQAVPGGMYAGAGNTNAYDITSYVTRSSTFFSKGNIYTGDTAFSARAIGNISRPFYPDGIDGNNPGPLSKPFSTWSPFNVGLQLDLVYSSFVASVLDASNGNSNCTGSVGTAGLSNGMQIFPGAVPIYRGSTLIGAIGVSGDGVDQDDMISFLGLARAGAASGTGFRNSPSLIRADTLPTPQDRLRYVQCPQAPFNNSSEQNVCDGI
ncbi:MAG: heme-binding protein, partial [Burkholderiaceae bacterium]